MPYYMEARTSQSQKDKSILSTRLMLQNICIAEQDWSKNSTSCLHRHIICVLYPEKIPWAHTFVFSRIHSESQVQVKTMYSSQLFWKLSRCDKEKANHVINGIDRHDNQEIAFNYFGCKHYTEAGTYYARQCTRTNLPSNKQQLLNPGGFKICSMTLKHIYLSFYIVLVVAQLG